MKASKTIHRVNKLLDTWTYRLGLRWWKVTVRFIHDPQTILDVFGNASGMELTLAQTTVSWPYGLATIQFNLPAIEKLDKETLRNTIVHELLHILVNEMREEGILHEERVVTQLQKAFMWTVMAMKEKEHHDT